jgi:predicted nucleotidyltransferase
MNAYYHTITAQIKKAVQQADPTATAILFGSRATGKAKKDSDWDVLILLNKSSVSLKDEQLFRSNLYDVELEIGEHISTLFYGAEDWNTRLSVTPLYKFIQQDKMVLWYSNYRYFNALLRVVLD